MGTRWSRVPGPQAADGRGAIQTRSGGRLEAVEGRVWRPFGSCGGASFLRLGLLGALSLLVTLATPAVGRGALPLAGAVVEAPASGKAGAVLAGDILTRWERLDETGAVVSAGGMRSPFETVVLVWEESLQGALRLAGHRGETPVEVTFGVDAYALDLRPAMPEPVLRAYHSARTAQSGGNEDAYSAAEKAADLAAGSGDPVLAAWILFDVAGRADPGAKDPRSSTLMRRAVDLLPADELEALAWGRLLLGKHLTEAQVIAEAFPVLEASQRYWTSLPEPRLAEASVQDLLARLYQRKGDDPSSEPFQRMCAELTERLAPRSWFAVVARGNVGYLRYRRGDLAGAERDWQRALALAEKAPKATPARRATLLLNLGSLAIRRGNLTEAERRYRRVLAIREETGASPEALANIHHNLGGLAYKRGKFEEAQDQFERALAIRKALDPRSEAVAQLLNNLASVAEERRDMDSAQRYAAEALELHRAIDPNSLGVAASLGRLATFARRQGDLKGAEAFAAEALALRQAKAPDSLEVAASLTVMGEVAFAARDFARAEESFQKALLLRRREAPGSMMTAKAEYELALVYWSRGDLARAEEHYRDAVAELEAQRGRFGGGDEAAQAFASLYANYYRDCVQTEALLGHDAEAFSTLERFRARGLLAMLSERDLDFSKDLSAEILAKQRLVRAQCAKAQAALARTSPVADAERYKAAARDLREANSQAAALAEEVRRLSPTLASLQDPTPMDLEAARRAFGPGTLLVSYCAAQEHLVLFALLDGRLKVRVLPMTSPQLARRVKYFRALLEDPYGSREALERESARLGTELLGPVSRQIRRCKRLVICPDSVLHALPFGALSLGGKRPLGAEVPLTSTLSATLWAESHRVPPLASGDLDCVAFGAPEPGGALGGGSLPPWREGLEPIPETAREAEAIAALFAPKSRLLLGREATEASAKAVGKEVSYLHFACHGYLDTRFPLSSGLVLSEPADGGSEDPSGDGLLQAWEIFEECRLDARVVTLSACETGLGRERGGEGLVGLTRAFQYAGARAVLSSLWRVPDHSTAELMERFYGGILRGKLPSEALRDARREMASRPATAHPFFWAGFVLHGD